MKTPKKWLKKREDSRINCTCTLVPYTSPEQEEQARIIHEELVQRGGEIKITINGEEI